MNTGKLMKAKLQAALDRLRRFLEAVMGAQAYDEAAFQQQMRELARGAQENAEDEPSPPR